MHDWSSSDVWITHSGFINLTGTHLLRALIYGLAILHLGPGFAFAVVAFGCDGLDPALGAFCQQDSFALFVRLTLAAWAVMIAVLLLKISITNYMNKK